MHSGSLDGIEEEQRKRRIESFDEAIDAITKLTASFAGFEKTQSQMKEMLGDLIVSRYTYIKNQ